MDRNGGGVGTIFDDSRSVVVYLRADGLPVDQASSLAFDHDGNLFVATQCDGVEMASASDNYHTWRQVTAPTSQPATQTGAGLPSNNINDIVVTNDGAIFVATDRGLARSVDHGQTWTFWRGADWIEKVKGSIRGEPPDWHPKTDPPPTIKEDYVTALAEDQAHWLWVGYRSKGYQCVDEKTLAVLDPGSEQQCDFVSLIAPVANQPPLIGTRGWGLRQAFAKLDPAGPLPAHPVVATSAVAFPSPAAAPGEAQLEEMTAKVKAMSDPPTVVAFLSEDWTTQGDWVGRYGRQQTRWPAFGYFNSDNRNFSIDIHMGPHHKDEQGLPYEYYGSTDSKLPRTLLTGTRTTNGRRMERRRL